MYLTRTLFAALMIAILTMLCGHSVAAEQPVSKIISSVSAWDIAETLSKQIKNKEFKKVESYIDKLVAEKPYSMNGRRLLEEVYERLEGRLSLRPQIDLWCSKSQHHAPFLIRGAQGIKLGWKARGDGFGYTVDQQSSQTFREELKLAESDLKTALQRNPQDPNSAAYLITICMALGKTRIEMEAYFKKAIDKDPQTLHSYDRKLAYLLPRWGGDTASETEFVDHCYNNPPTGSIVYKIQLSSIIWKLGWEKNKQEYYQKNKLSAQIKNVIDRWIAEYPNSPDATYYFSWFYSWEGNNEKKVYFANKTLEIDPKHQRTLILLGNHYCQQATRDGYKKAKEYFSKAEKYYPDDPEVLSSLGAIIVQTGGKFDDAYLYYTKAIHLAGRNTGYLSSRAWLLSEYGKSNEAIQDYSTIIDIDPHDVFAHISRGQGYRAIGQETKAMSDFTMAEKLIFDGHYRGPEKMKMFYLDKVQSLKKNQQTFDYSNAVSLSKEQAIQYSKHKGDLDLKIDLLTPDIASILAQHKGTLKFSGLKQIDPSSAKALASHEGLLNFSALELLDPESAEPLVRSQEWLEFRSKIITPQLARAISTGKGSIKITGVENIPLESAKALHGFQGTLYIYFNGTISPAAAKELSPYPGAFEFHQTQSLSLELAKGFGKCKANLRFMNLTVLTPEVAEALGQHKGELTFRDLKELIPESAKNITKSPKQIFFSGVEKLTPEIASAFNLSKTDLLFDKLKKIDLETARALALHNGKLIFFQLQKPDAATLAELMKHKQPIQFPSW